MKILRIVLIILIVLVLAIAGISVYVATNARAILVTQLERNLGIRLEIEALRVALPDTIIAEGVALSDTLKIKRLQVTPSLIGLLQGEAGFNSIIAEGLEATVTRNADNTFDYGLPVVKALPSAQPPQAPLKEPEAAQAPAAQKEQPPSVYIKELLVKEASVTFIDKSLVGQGPFVIKCVPLDIFVSRFSLAHASRMQVSGQGRLAAVDGKDVGTVKVSGWFDPFKRDMDAGLTLESGRIVHFAPYYKPYFNRDLASGNVAAHVDARSKDNALTADVHIALANVGFKQPEGAVEGQGEQQADLENFGFMVFDSLLSSEGGIDIDFTVRTKMDAPKFENVSFKGNFFQNRIKATFSKPPQETVEDFKKVGEQFEAIGKEFKKIFSK